MIHTLQVARAEVGPLIAAMSIFVSEPTLEWIRMVPKFINVQPSQSASNLSTEFYPEEVIHRAEYILNGAHPAEITCRDLLKNKEYHKLHDESTINRVMAAVRGATNTNILYVNTPAPAKRRHDSLPYRATLPSNGLSVEQQVLLNFNFTNNMMITINVLFLFLF